MKYATVLFDNNTADESLKRSTVNLAAEEVRKKTKILYSRDRMQTAAAL